MAPNSSFMGKKTNKINFLLILAFFSLSLTLFSFSSAATPLSPQSSEPLTEIVLDDLVIVPRTKKQDLSGYNRAMAYFRFKIDFTTTPSNYLNPLTVQITLNGAEINKAPQNLDLDVKEDRDKLAAWESNAPGVLVSNSLDVYSLALGAKKNDLSFNLTTSNHFAVPLQVLDSATPLISTTPVVRFGEGVMSMVAMDKSDKDLAYDYYHKDFKTANLDKMPYYLYISFPLSEHMFTSAPQTLIDYKITVGLEVPDQGSKPTTFSTFTRDFEGQLDPLSTTSLPPETPSNIITPSPNPLQQGFSAFLYEKNGDSDGNTVGISDIVTKVSQKWAYLQPYRFYLVQNTQDDTTCPVDSTRFTTCGGTQDGSRYNCARSDFVTSEVFRAEYKQIDGNNLEISTKLLSPSSFSQSSFDILRSNLTRISCVADLNVSSSWGRDRFEPMIGYSDYRLNITDGIINGVMNYPSEEFRSRTYSRYYSYSDNMKAYFPSYVITSYWTENIQDVLGTTALTKLALNQVNPSDDGISPRDMYCFDCDLEDNSGGGYDGVDLGLVYFLIVGLPIIILVVIGVTVAICLYFRHKRNKKIDQQPTDGQVVVGDGGNVYNQPHVESTEMV